MSDDYRAIRNQDGAALAAAMAHVSREISGCWGPISGSDALSNLLLAERRRLTNALSTLGENVFIPTPRSPDLLAGAEGR